MTNHDHPSRTKLWAEWFGAGIVGYTIGALVSALILALVLNMAPESVTSGVLADAIIFFSLLAVGYTVQHRSGQFYPYAVVLMTFVSVIAWWEAVGLLTRYNSANLVQDLIGYTRNGVISALGALLGALLSRRLH